MGIVKPPTTTEDTLKHTATTAGQDLQKIGSHCCCMKTVTLMKIATVVGILIATVGTLALMGVLLPTAGSLTRFFIAVSSHTMTVATTLGTNPLSLAIFVTSMGGAFALGGALGWGIENAKLATIKPHHEKKIEDAPDQNSDDEHENDINAAQKESSVQNNDDSDLDVEDK